MFNCSSFWMLKRLNLENKTYNKWPCFCVLIGARFPGYEKDEFNPGSPPSLPQSRLPHHSSVQEQQQIDNYSYPIPPHVVAAATSSHRHPLVTIHSPDCHNHNANRASHSSSHWPTGHQSKGANDSEELPRNFFPSSMPHSSSSRMYSRNQTHTSSSGDKNRRRTIKKAQPRPASGRRLSYHTVSKCSSDEVTVELKTFFL